MALPTTIDNINATMYALDRVMRERCKQKITTTPGLEYRVEDDKRMYPCPSGIKDCEHGRCVISSKELCMKKSQLPYDSLGNERDGEPCIDGKCLNNKVCGKNNKCYSRKPYLEFHDGKCVYGNFVLRKWCEIPSSRRPEPEPGVTDVTPFVYDVTTGKCSISKPYCEKDMKVSYKVDEDGRPTCYSSTGQLAGEFFLGKTIFRGISGILIKENFAGDGIHLYLDNGKLTFDEAQVRNAYPKESYSIDELTKDYGLKRIYFITHNTNWLSDHVIKAMRRKMKN